MSAQLPTEHALCRCHRVSRFIVREAMSMLSVAGLMRRAPARWRRNCRTRLADRERIARVLDAELMRRTSAEWMPYRTFAV